MRKNKKNYPKEGEGWRELIHNRKKYAEYKIDTDHQSQGQLNTKKNQSLGKLSSIRPALHVDDTILPVLHNEDTARINLKSNTLHMKKTKKWSFLLLLKYLKSIHKLMQQFPWKS